MKKLLLLISCAFILSGYTACYAEVEPFNMDEALKLEDAIPLDSGDYWEDWGDDYYYYGDDYSVYYEDNSGYSYYNDLTGDWDAGSWESDGYVWWDESTWDTGADYLSDAAYGQLPYGGDDSDLLLPDELWDGQEVIGAANEPEPFYFPIQPFSDEEIDLARKKDVEKYGPEVGNRIIDDAIFANTLTGPQFDSVMMGEGGLEWGGLADFVEQGVKDGTVDIHKKTWDEELARVGPEGKASHEIAFDRNLLGIFKPYISGQVEFDNDQESNIIFTANHREWPNSERAFANKLTNTIIIDTKGAALRAERNKELVAVTDDIVKKHGWPTNSLGTAGLTDNELFLGDISNSVIHEGEHLNIKEKVENMVENGIPVHIKKYYSRLPRDDETLHRSIGELAAMTKQIGEGSFSNLEMLQMDYGVTSAINKTVLLDPAQIPHFYANQAIVPRVLNGVGYPDFMANAYADKYLFSREVLEDPFFGRGAIELQRTRGRIREDAKTEYAPDGQGSRIIFLEQTDPKKLNQMGIRHHDALFGKTPSIKPESLEQFKDEVIDQYEFNKSYRY